MRARRGAAVRLGVLAAVLWAAVAGASEAAFPGRDGRIVFTTPHGRIGTMRADGRDVRYLSARGTTPTWSPDGRRVVFVPLCGPGGRQCTDELRVLSVSSGATRRIKLAPVPGLPSGPFTPSWSPNGHRLVFLRSDRNDFSKIVISYADGSHETVLGRVFEGVGAPAWSPDGHRIAFSDEVHVATVALGTTSGATRELYAGALPDSVFSPSWSPDGQRLAFLDVARGPRRALRLNVIDRDGGGLRRLRLEPGRTARTHRVVWSPDGSAIATLTAHGRLEIGSVDRSPSRPLGPPMTWFDWQPLGD
jgi:Tol biopolymer transport system component